MSNKILEPQEQITTILSAYHMMDKLSVLGGQAQLLLDIKKLLLEAAQSIKAQSDANVCTKTGCPNKQSPNGDTSGANDSSGSV